MSEGTDSLAPGRSKVESLGGGEPLHGGPAFKMPPGGFTDDYRLNWVDDEIVRVGTTVFVPNWIPHSATLKEILENAIPYSELSVSAKKRLWDRVSHRLKLKLQRG